METTEKIKNGTIRIENGKLIGLGHSENATLDIESLDALLKALDKGDIINSLSNTISGIGRSVAYLIRFNFDESESEMFDNVVRNFMPGEEELYCLNELINTLTK